MEKVKQGDATARGLACNFDDLHTYDRRDRRQVLVC